MDEKYEIATSSSSSKLTTLLAEQKAKPSTPNTPIPASNIQHYSDEDDDKITVVGSYVPPSKQKTHFLSAQPPILFNKPIRERAQSDCANSSDSDFLQFSDDDDLPFKMD